MKIGQSVKYYRKRFHEPQKTWSYDLTVKFWRFIFIIEKNRGAQDGFIRSDFSITCRIDEACIHDSKSHRNCRSFCGKSQYDLIQIWGQFNCICLYDCRNGPRKNLLNRIKSEIQSSPPSVHQISSTPMIPRSQSLPRYERHFIIIPQSKHPQSQFFIFNSDNFFTFVEFSFEERGVPISDTNKDIILQLNQHPCFGKSEARTNKLERFSTGQLKIRTLLMRLVQRHGSNECMTKTIYKTQKTLSWKS
jgi:hypothetical protein